ncbi:MAG: AraC family transcriptional regulator [Gammaproteobacteria bacterium]|nr:MAG: AraC family transcriptional regulator [Gammaproteobacteria bacterium]UTW41409.1 AraC family transcriptional regulator ligand-binding domain-containing protein [bacterium SCSIO 12844]
MFQSNISLPSYCIRQIITIISEHHKHLNTWINKKFMNEKHLNDPVISLAWSDFYQLLKQAKKLLNNPSIGLMVGDRLLTNTHGILGFAMMNSASLRQSINLLENFLPLRTNLISIKQQSQGGYLLIQINENHPLDDVKEIIIEAVALALKRLIDYITMTSNNSIYVAFSFAENSQAQLASDLFQCDIIYNQPFNGIALPLSILDKPLPMADTETYIYAVNICQKELETINKKPLISQQIYQLLLESKHYAQPLESIAQKFHLSPRTMHRRLLKEGTTYREILETVKHTLAISYLRNKQMAIQEIAFNLGYHDVANFRRAFKRWEGVPPSKYLEKIVI